MPDPVAPDPQPVPPTTPATSPATSPAEASGNPAMQGEGNVTAARRHRLSVKKFVDAGRVQPAADNASPQSDAEAQTLRDAEAEGRSHARR